MSAMFVLLPVLGILYTMVLAKLPCDPSQMMGCDRSAIRPGMVLIHVESIDFECSDFKHAFDCAEKHLSGCSKTQQMVWRPVQAQVHVVCNTSKSVYMQSAKCWEVRELEKGVMECNNQYLNSLEEISCGDIDNYESCLEGLAAQLCDTSAAKVMGDMAKAYMSEIRKVCQQPTETTTRTLAGASSDTQRVLADVTVVDMQTSTTGTSGGQNTNRQTDVTQPLVEETEQETNHSSSSATGQLSHACSKRQTFHISIFACAILMHII